MVTLSVSPCPEPGHIVRLHVHARRHHLPAGGGRLARWHGLVALAGHVVDVVDGGRPAGTYTRPLFLLNISTFFDISRLTSVCPWQKRLRLS